MPSKIVIVDYGMGNLNSVKKAIYRMKVKSLVSSDPKDIAGCDKIILPGVGHFGKAMNNIRKLNLLDILNETVLVKRKPILGICLGMQLMANKSEEGDCKGLGWLDAEVVKLNVTNKIRYKIPQMGWNQIHKKKESRLFENIPDFSDFYFMHSYFLKLNDQTDLLNETDYNFRYASAVEKDNIFGVQYHPEKSHDIGAALLKNFIEL